MLTNPYYFKHFDYLKNLSESDKLKMLVNSRKINLNLTWQLCATNGDKLKIYRATESVHTHICLVWLHTSRFLKFNSSFRRQLRIN
jgi:hypothetical protein